jgi:hypothetical protein
MFIAVIYYHLPSSHFPLCWQWYKWCLIMVFEMRMKFCELHYSKNTAT